MPDDSVALRRGYASQRRGVFFVDPDQDETTFPVRERADCFGDVELVALGLEPDGQVFGEEVFVDQID